MKPALKLLVVALDNLGDLVFTTSLLQTLRTGFPAGFIGLWCKNYARPVAELMSGVDRIHDVDPFWDKSPGQAAGRFADFLAAVREIRAEKYDLVLLLTRGSKPVLAARLLGAKAVIGRQGSRLSALLDGAVPLSQAHVPVLAELNEFARATKAWSSPKLPVHQTAIEAGPLPPCRLMRPRSVNGSPFLPEGTVALHPFAGSQRRCVPFPVWKGFSHRLIEAGHNVLWIGSSNELSAIRNGAELSGREYFVDQLEGLAPGLRGSIEAIASCNFFVGHDSGPLHVAGALGVPVLGIYAPGEPGRTFPQGAGVRRWVYRASPSEFDVSLFWEEFKAAQAQCEGVQGSHP